MVKFNFSYAEGTSLEQMLLFETAGQIWGEYLRDEVDINLHVGMVDAALLPQGVIGGALPGVKASQGYQAFRSNYRQDMTSADDRDGYKTFKQNGAEYEFKVPEPDEDDDDTWTQEGEIETLDLSRANAKALGLDVGDAEALDGYIVLSDLKGTGIRWDEGADRRNSARKDRLEMLSVALHEIGHVLGFISAVDTPGWVKQLAPGSSWQRTKQQMDELAQTAMPLDLFRYVDDGGRVDLSYGNIGGRKYFALDQGDDNLAEFATGVDKTEGGDGDQASHWKRRGGKKSIGIMAPALSPGDRSEISTVDLRLFDVIGWDLAQPKVQGQRPGGNDDDDDDGSSRTYKNVKLLKTFGAQYEAAEQTVAQKLGLSVADLRRRPHAAEALTQNRDREVFDMLVESQIYDLGWRNWRSWGSRSFWEVLENAFQSRGLYSKTDADLLDASQINASQKGGRDRLTGLAEGDAVTPVEEDNFVTQPNLSVAETNPTAAGSLLTAEAAIETKLPIPTVLKAELGASQAESADASEERQAVVLPWKLGRRAFALGRADGSSALERPFASGLRQDQLLSVWSGLAFYSR